MKQLIEKWGIKKVTYIGFSLLLLLLFVPMSGKIWEDIDAGEIVVIQDFFDGDLHVYSQSGPVLQAFGKVTHYRKSFTFDFNKDVKIIDKDTIIDDKSIKIRFSEGGNAQIGGSVRIDLPIDEKGFIELHSKFGSQESIENMLVRPILSKAIYMTGPLLSSKESASEKRNYLLTYIDDQASEGVYKTKLKETKIYDSILKQEKINTQVEIIEKNGIVQRQEVSLFKQYNIQISNLSINDIEYDKNVEDQIRLQQQATMQVQTAMANAKKAEQEAITTEMQGKANAAKAKWEQEVKKAIAVTAAIQEKEVAITKAEKDREVAELASKQAAFYKQKMILEGEGEAAKKRLLMASNNMLEYRIDAWERVNTEYAKALSSSNWVPTTLIGGCGYGPNSGGQGDAGQALINMLMVKTANDLGISPKPTK